MKRYEVFYTKKARRDLAAIISYIEEHDSKASARRVLAQIEKVATSLATSPTRGAYVSELVELGMRDFRQTHFKPYRLIYRITEFAVIIMVIADARRDMEALLRDRLLHASMPGDE